MMLIVSCVAGSRPIELWVGGVGVGKLWRGWWGVYPVRVQERNRGVRSCPWLLGEVIRGTRGYMGLQKGNN